ncbi:MAG: hypothetical protein R2744_03350 [Bacteroidales bacterium]
MGSSYAQKPGWRQPLFAGIRVYYDRYQNGNALTDDFVRVMEEVSGAELDSFFSQWLTRPDLPRIELKWAYNRSRGEVTITIGQTQDGEPFGFNTEVQLMTESGSGLLNAM